MSLVCELTGKRRLKGNKVSHSNIKTRKFSLPNLVKRKWFITELKQTVTLRLSSAALRTIDFRGGIERAILQERDTNLSERLLSVKRQLQRKRLESLRVSKKEAPAREEIVKEA